jgi:Ca-activated chloride channel family protein
MKKMNADQPDYPDLILDRALAELVGGETPPDLSERILAAAQNTTEPVTLAEGTHAMSTATLKQASRFKSWAILAASLACVGTVIGLTLPGRNAAHRLSEHDIVAKIEDSSDLDRAEKRYSEARDTDGLEMMVTPHIIIEEEEEERLGLADGEPAREPLSRDKLESAVQQFNEHREAGRYSEMEQVAEELHKADPNHPVSQQVWDVAKFIRREMLDRELKEQGEAGVITAESDSAGQQAYESRKSQNLSARSKSASTGTEFGFRPEQSSEPVKWSALSNRKSEQESLARRSGRGGEVGTPAPQFVPNSSLGLNGQINDANAVDKLADLRGRGMRFRIDAAPGQDEPQLGTGPGNSGDQYTRIYENPFITAKGGDAVSTFSIDVDTASYANVRQFLTSGQLPPPDAVRIEELLNYFPYNYEGPKDDTPFAAHMEVAACPWNPEHRLARIAIKGKEIDRKARPQSNLVFLIDVSGSMDVPNKLPLLIDGMKLLTRELGENDKVAIVVYASSEGMALPSTRGDQQQTILAALDNLRAGGSTAGGAGINLAYQVAQENFIKGGVNRVILCTDGDFNVGVTDTAALTRLAEEKAKSTKVFLTVLGFGRGNLNDAMMEAISGKGNGNYHYVDNLTEARKVLVEEMSGTLVAIAKDVKIQVEFNPAQVAGYRLIGYENRMLRTEDFNDDKKDAGEIGAGHTVTALYEIVPPGETVGTASVDPLKYQQQPLANQSPSPQSAGERLGEGPASDELLTLKLRYKLPDADTSTKLEFPITDRGGSFADATDDFQFAAAVASFGMLLRGSEHKGNATFDAALEIAQSALGEDPHGYRGEFLELVRQAKELTCGQPSSTTIPSQTEGS